MSTFMDWMNGINLVVGGLTVLAFLLATALVTLDCVVSKWRVGYWVAAYMWWRLKIPARGKVALEKYFDPDKRYEKERDRLRRENIELRSKHSDVIMVANHLLQHYGDGSEKNPYGTRYNLDDLDVDEAAHYLAEMIRRKQQEREEAKQDA